ncbi:uncharacterized protein [Bemisia tabaci]|uniref:uncharacterized protein n=1 Tax=Bemisia tabaci TaxID=7038 RepID=UPI003B2810DD
MSKYIFFKSSKGEEFGVPVATVQKTLVCYFPTVFKNKKQSDEKTREFASKLCQADIDSLQQFKVEPTEWKIENGRILNISSANTPAVFFELKKRGIAFEGTLEEARKYLLRLEKKAFPNTSETAERSEETKESDDQTGGYVNPIRIYNNPENFIPDKITENTPITPGLENVTLENDWENLSCDQRYSYAFNESFTTEENLNSGIGYQTNDFYDAIMPQDLLLGNPNNYQIKVKVEALPKFSGGDNENIKTFLANYEDQLRELSVAEKKYYLWNCLQGGAKKFYENEKAEFQACETYEEIKKKLLKKFESVETDWLM